MDLHPKLLVTSSLCDFLSPKKEVHSPHYENFISQYSEITVSAIVSQGNLDEKMFQEPLEFLETHIDEFIDGITTHAMQLRRKFPSYSILLGFNQGEFIQNMEERTFVTEYFKNKSKKLEISNRIHVMRTLNASAFHSYFSLFGSVLEDIYREVKPTSLVKNITGGVLIEHCLKEILKINKIITAFYDVLGKRSKFFLSKEILISSWGFLNLIRNRQAHYNNYYDDNANKELNKNYTNIINSLSKIENSDVLVDVFKMNFGDIVAQVKDDGFLVFNNTLENFVRNTTLIIMESLYICELEKCKISKE